MAYVLADQQGWLNKASKEENSSPMSFSVLNNFKAMRDSVNDASTDFFMWELFTTKPYHDTNEVRCIGKITPPWPAFMFAAHIDVLDAPELPRALLAIQKATKLFMEQKDDESIKHIIRILDYQEQDVRDWFKTVHYAPDLTGISQRALQVTVSTLQKAGVVGANGPSVDELCYLKVGHLIE